VISSPPLGVQSIAMSVSACMSVRLLAYLKKTCPTSRNFCTCYLWPWLGALWRQCTMLRTSGFVADVTFVHNQRGKGIYSKWLTRGQNRG